MPGMHGGQAQEGGMQVDGFVWYDEVQEMIDICNYFQYVNELGLVIMGWYKNNKIQTNEWTRRNNPEAGANPTKYNSWNLTLIEYSINTNPYSNYYPTVIK